MNVITVLTLVGLLAQLLEEVASFESYHDIKVELAAAEKNIIENERFENRNLVIGGKAVDPCEFPSYVLLARPGHSGHCGAVILDSYTVLTAAHCIVAEMEVRIERGPWSNQTIKVRGACQSERYVMNDYFSCNDFAVVALDEKIKFSNFVGGATLAHEPLGYGELVESIGQGDPAGNGPLKLTEAELTDCSSGCGNYCKSGCDPRRNLCFLYMASKLKGLTFYGK